MAKLATGVASAFLACLLLAAAPAQALAYEQVEDIVAYGHGTNAAGYLVIHETANPGASAYNHTLLWARDGTYAVHYVMELDGSVVYHTMPDWALAWHVGGGNYQSVGIELAHATDAASFAKQWDEAVAWAGDYLRSRGWGVDRLISHDEARLMWGGTDHTDPTGYFAAYGRTFDGFRSDVAAYLGGSFAGGGAASGGSGVGGSSGFAGGTYVSTVDALNVRDRPGLAGSVVAQYGRGQTVVLDSWYASSDGYVWGRYTAWSGATRYVAVGRDTGRPEADDYLVAAGSQAQAPASAAGTYTVTADALNVRDAPWGGVVAQYGYGQTVRIDGTVTASDGSVWGYYTAWSGATRYVSMDWLS